VTEYAARLPGDHLFSGSADLYERFLPHYPAELFYHLLDHIERSSRGRLLDLGCGTGRLALPLGRHFDEAWAVDVSAEMIARGRAEAEIGGSANIRWLVERAEALNAPEEHFDLVTIGAAFHWMDRECVGEHIARWLRPQGWVAIVGVNSPWNRAEDLQRVALSVIRRWLDERRRAGCGVFEAPRQRHEEVLAAIGFRDITETVFPVCHRWTLDEFVGYLHSTSFASPGALGERQQRFQADLRCSLLAAEPEGRFSETLRFHCIVARRPG
jgi:ubiquinone/menaquinone biosynthesis C-methylase UbiE